MKTENNNKISVIMGIYNCAVTLPHAIDSILAQTYENWELILCDDSSIDNTYQVAKSYQEKYPDKIILIQNESNKRLAYSLNHCLKYATGKYIARMDGDDLSTPDRFEKQVLFLENHPDVDLVGSEMQYFNEKGIGKVVGKNEKPDRFALKTYQPFHHATIMTYKYVYEKVGGYTVAERTKRAQDYDLWFKFYAADFNGMNIQEPLYLVREDEAAIKRRTFNVRWNAFKTTRIGFEMLGYPKHWLIRPACEMIFKSLIPTKLWLIYREFQNRKGK